MTRIEERNGMWTLYTNELNEGAFRAACSLASEHVVVEAFRPIPSVMWTDLTIQLQPSLPAEVLSVREVRLDLRLSRDDFVRLFSVWRVGGVQAWFLARRCPDTLRILELADPKRLQILAALGFTLEFNWPLPAIGDWASFGSMNGDLIRSIAATLNAGST